MTLREHISEQPPVKIQQVDAAAQQDMLAVIDELGLLAVAAAMTVGMLAAAGPEIVQISAGNYGVFNLLAIALCVVLLDDGVWPAWLRARLTPGAMPERGWLWPNRILRPVAVTLAVTLRFASWRKLSASGRS